MKRLKKQENETRLERVARVWLNSRAADYDSGWEGAYRDLERGGCSSGLVGKLIYYRDTIRFYKRYQREISDLLTLTMEETGLLSMTDIFGDKWDNLDPLASEEQNRNLLAWFGFEEAARQVAQANGYND